VVAGSVFSALLERNAELERLDVAPGPTLDDVDRRDGDTRGRCCAVMLIRSSIDGTSRRRWNFSP